ncbi:MAG: asparagine synthase-related protein [Phenylobacterium sp.]|uniref:asparagine synthase-related protein n=1 Tax=Phenylobacterium sp. TaxID=1871053 RepID=UPI0027333706|nr:asparagine synthase-related protein [Phenylobacterium sp.]MDP3749277.1 asparagine synthase-related protein [Phenylobacterium sp.]
MLETRWGAYVAIEVEAARRSVRVLRDPTGRIECWKLSLEGLDVIFSHYEDVQWLQPRRSPINWDYVAYHLNNDWLRGDETGLEDISEVLPGEELLYLDGRPSKSRPWRPDKIAAERFATMDEAQRAIRQAAESAVTEWAARYGTIALDLSGGLDSSIVLGLLKRCAKHPNVVGANWVIAHAEGDERAFARAAAELHGVRLIEAEISPENLRFGAPVAHRLMRPSIRSMPLGYDERGAQIAKEIGADAYFTGTAGDHIFYDYLQVNAGSDYLHDRAPLGGAIGTAHQLAQVSKNTIWSVCGAALSDYVGGPKPLHQMFKNRNPFAAHEMSEAELNRFIHPWAHDGLHHTPPAKLQQVLNISELQRHYWRYGRADVSEEVHPLFSQPLVEACLRTPAYWFCAGGIQRGLARRIFSDLLPASIRTRRTKGANTSHWVRVMTQNLPHVRELMLEGHLASRGLLNRARMEEELTPLAMAAAKAQGPLAVCLTTEIWIQQTEANRGRSAPSGTLMAV